jgi:hypothetical protein
MRWKERMSMKNKIVRKLMQKLDTHSECRAVFWTEDGKRNLALGELVFSNQRGKAIVKARWLCKTCSQSKNIYPRDRKHDHYATYI